MPKVIPPGLEIRERLARDSPTVTDYQSNLALSHINIGSMLRATGHRDDALKSHRRALEIRERLACDNPPSPTTSEAWQTATMISEICWTTWAVGTTP